LLHQMPPLIKGDMASRPVRRPEPARRAGQKSYFFIWIL